MRWRWLIGAGIAAFLGLIGIVGWRWMNQPSVGAQVESAVNTASSQPSVADIEVTSPYFSTRVSSSLETRSRQDEANASVLERHIFGSGITEGDRLAITVSTLPPGGLKDVPDVHIREAHPATYEKDMPAYLPSGAMGFVAHVDTYEQVVFMSNGKQYASVVVTGRADRAAMLRGMLETVVLNWQWQS